MHTYTHKHKQHGKLAYLWCIPIDKGTPSYQRITNKLQSKGWCTKGGLCSFCLFVWNKVCYELVVCVPAFDLNVSHDALSSVEFVLRCPSSLGLHHVCYWTLFTMKSGLCSESDGSIGKTTSKLPWLLFPSSMMRYFLRLLSPVWGTAVRLGAIHAPLPKTSGHAPLHPEH